MNGPAAVTNPQDFEFFLKTNSQAMVLFHSSWCPFCRRFLPVFEREATERGKNLAFGVIRDQDDLEDRFRVQVVPTVLFFANGALVKRLDGVAGYGIDAHQLASFIDTCMLKPQFGKSTSL